MYNPYLELASKEIARCRRLNVGLFNPARTELTTKYSWAIPNEEAIKEIVKYSPIVEGGAGTGYWASLIHQAGGDIICYDIAPPGETHNIYQHKAQYHRVHLGDAEIMKNHHDKTLMLCWAPYNTDMGYDHITAHQGKNLILIGESKYGCTGNDKMFDYVEQHYSLVKEIFIPRWNGINDSVQIYCRR
jgi:hypothetical protein